jgi:hypothetical protein
MTNLEKFMTYNNFDAIHEHWRTEYAELTDSYDYLVHENERLKVKLKMLENKNHILTAKLNKSEKTQEFVFDGRGGK